MDRVEDHILAVITPRMAGDDLPAAADHDLIDIAPYPDIAVTIGDGHRNRWSGSGLATVNSPGPSPVRRHQRAQAAGPPSPADPAGAAARSSRYGPAG